MPSKTSLALRSTPANRETTMNTEEHIETLRLEVADLKAQLEGFTAVTVQLRIDGVVRPVVLFAKQDQPEPASPFAVVRGDAA